METARFLSGTDRMLPGILQTETVPNPALGAPFTFTVPGGQLWRVCSLSYNLHKDGTGTWHLPALQFVCGGLLVAQIPHNLGVNTAAADGVATYAPGLALAEQNFGNATTHAIPDIWLQQGDQVVGTFVIGGGTDAFQNIVALVEHVFATNQELSELQEERYEHVMASRG